MINAEDKARAQADFSAFKWLMLNHAIPAEEEKENWKYIPKRHLTLVDRMLMSATQYYETKGQMGHGRFIISMPPRHGKSLSASQLFPAWFLGRNPDKKIILASYGLDLATKHSRFARDWVATDIYNAIFDISAGKLKSVRNWDLWGYDGSMMATGIRGAITGAGADVLIIDDYLKNREEAESKRTRDAIWAEYQDTLITRLDVNYAVVIVIATRWHGDDLIGRLLKYRAHENWQMLRLPALAEANDPLGRDIDEPLWEMKQSKVQLENERRINPYGFSALFQQRPIPAGNSMFNHDAVEIVDDVPEMVKQVRFYDLAWTEGLTSDYTAGVKMGLANTGDIYILDLYHQRKTPDKSAEDIINIAQFDGKDTDIRLETSNAGKLQLGFLLRDSRLLGFRVDGERPIGSKNVRAGDFASRWNVGKVKLVRAKWNQTLLDELIYFPDAPHDDIVDACSGAYNMIANLYIPKKSDWIMM